MIRWMHGMDVHERIIVHLILLYDMNFSMTIRKSWLLIKQYSADPKTIGLLYSFRSPIKVPSIVILYFTTFESSRRGTGTEYLF